MKQIKTVLLCLNIICKMKGCFLVGFERHCWYCSVAQSCPTLWPCGFQHTRFPCPSPSPGVCSDSCPLSWWCHPNHFRALLSLSPPAFNLCQPQGLFQWVGSLHHVARGGASASASSDEYSGLISFRIDRFDLLALQGTLKSLLWHHRSKASILWCSAFFMVQLLHPYVTTGKTIALTI